MNQQKTLVITGASRGIGAATAALFLEKGFKVINLSRSVPELGDIVHVNVDLADAKAVENVADRLLAEISGVGPVTLIHNAGLLRKDSAIEMAVDEFARVMQVNVLAQSQLNRIMLPRLVPGSSILFVGSTLAEKAVANSCSYVASKHAQAGLMRATCQDLAGKGIHTACICPGFTDTEMLGEHVGNDRNILNQLAAGNGMERLVEPDEIASALYFAALNPVINGSLIHANLGQLET